MSEKNWTPGPWSVRDEGFGEVVDPKGRGVADTAVDMQENARLVAAAPELYEALEGCLNDLAEHNIESGNARYAAHVLAKARGEE